MPQSRPVSAARARALALKARRKAREEALLAERAVQEELAAESLRLEAKRLAAEEEAERRKASRTVREAATEAAHRIVERCLKDAISGGHKSTILIELESGNPSILTRLEGTTIDVLTDIGFVVDLGEHKAELTVSWQNISWESQLLAGKLSIGHLAWLSSVSGQGLLQNIWGAVAAAAAADNFRVVLRAIPLTTNRDRWGANDVHKVVLKHTPIGVLPTPISFLTKLLKRQGYGCIAQETSSGAQTIEIAW